ncbi:MAG: O-antigen ligase family protein, partial [Pseudomonadota bacterium]
VGVAIIVPRATAFALCLYALSVLVQEVLRRRPIERAWFTSPLTLALAAFLTWAGLSLTWSQAPMIGLTVVGYATVLSIIVTLLAFRLSQLTGDVRYWHERGVAVGLGCGLIFLLIEFALNNPIITNMVETFPGLIAAKGKGFQFQGDRIAVVQDMFYNRHLASLALLVIPAAIAGAPFISQKARFAAGLTAFLLALALVAQGASGAAGLAIAVAGCVWLAARWRCAAGKWVVIGGLILAIAGVLPIAAGLARSGMITNEAIPFSARARIAIWEYTRQETLKSPVIGHGVQTAQARQDAINAQRVAAGARPTSDRFELRPGRHAHNIFLQVWFELGLVGAALLFAVGYSAVSQAARLPSALRPACLAFIAGTFALGAVSWSLWSTWVLAVVAVGVLIISLAIGRARCGGEAPDHCSP